MQKAAEAFRMSYRNAWGDLGELERAAGYKFVERAAGGGPTSGMRLTKEAKQFPDRYWMFGAGVECPAKRHCAPTFRVGRRRSQQILDHATLAMTMRYAHLSPKHLRDEMARTERPAQAERLPEPTEEIAQEITREVKSGRCSP